MKNNPRDMTPSIIAEYKKMSRDELLEVAIDLINEADDDHETNIYLLGRISQLEPTVNGLAKDAGEYLVTIARLEKELEDEQEAHSLSKYPGDSM